MVCVSVKTIVLLVTSPLSKAFFSPFFFFVLKASLIISTTCMFRTLQEHWVPHCTVLNLNPDSCSLLGSASSDVRLL